MTQKLDLSVVIITYNEEINLPYTLSNISDLAKEVIVVDSYSTDKTVEIAKEHNARIYYRHFDNFSNQRKFSLEKINFNTKWLLVLDADETLTDALKDELRLTINKTDKDAFYIKRKFFWQNHWIKWGYYPTWLLRLGKTGFMTCEDKATMFPIMEIVGHRHHFINYFLYCYNDLNPINISKSQELSRLKKINDYEIRNKSVVS